jgi:UDP-glucose 4-epimerase
VILNTDFLRKTLRDHDTDSRIHFAGLKSVAESIDVPLKYYENNVVGTISLIKAMKSEGVHQPMFISSATVYGRPKSLPITEDHPTSALNPHGYSKLHIEQMLSDLVTYMLDIRIVNLRYFNPA